MRSFSFWENPTPWKFKAIPVSRFICAMVLFWMRKNKAAYRELFIGWYKKEAKKIIAARVEWWARRFCLAYKSVNITCANRRWGSCAPNDRLNFSWRLVMAPISVIDYVVVHELAHITHKNHSRRFWSRVKAMYPDHKDAKTWLRENEGMLNL